jgi:hypothetical protein
MLNFKSLCAREEISPTYPFLDNLIDTFLFGVILQTAVIVVQYTFWQFLTPIPPNFVRNPGSDSAAVCLTYLIKNNLLTMLHE